MKNRQRPSLRVIRPHQTQLAIASLLGFTIGSGRDRPTHDPDGFIKRLSETASFRFVVWSLYFVGYTHVDSQFPIPNPHRLHSSLSPSVIRFIPKH